MVPISEPSRPDKETRCGWTSNSKGSQILKGNPFDMASQIALLRICSLTRHEAKMAASYHATGSHGDQQLLYDLSGSGSLEQASIEIRTI